MEKKRFNAFAEYQWKQRQARKKWENKEAAGLTCQCSHPMQIHSDDTDCDWCGKELKRDF